VIPREKTITEKQVILKYYAKMREITGKAEEKISFPDHLTLNDLFSILYSTHGSIFKDYIVGADGNLRDNIGILVNGSPINLEARDVGINDSDVVVILPPIAGG
jgi:molybdopterin synthase sulfur carrier subunit